MPWPKGKPRSAETRRKVADSLRGQTRSAETRRRQSEARKKWIAEHPDEFEAVRQKGSMAPKPGNSRPLWDRFWEKVDAEGPCWEWTSNSTTAKSGYVYGQVHNPGGSRLAHRVAWELLVGPIPEGLELDHLCKNTICVNPDHLEPVTRKEHLTRWKGHPYAKRTHCKRGHAYAEHGLLDARGYRQCGECARCRAQRRNRK